MPESQGKIDFSRSEQLGILRAAVLPKVAGISRHVLKSLLRVIDDHARREGECFTSQETMAQEANCSLRQLERAIAALVKMSLITKERRSVGHGRMTLNFHRIVWSELELLSVNQPATYGGLIEEDQPAISVDQPAKSVYQPAISVDQPAMHGGFLGSVLSATSNRHHQGRDDWGLVVEEFEKRFATVEQLAEQARAAGSTAAEFGAKIRSAIRTAEHPENRRKFNDQDAAVVWFLGRGMWPTGGVRSIDDIDREAQRKAREANQAERGRAFWECVKRLRGQGLTDETMTPELRAKFGDDCLKQSGWKL